MAKVGVSRGCALLLLGFLVCASPGRAQDAVPTGSYGPPVCAAERPSARPATPETMRAEQERGALLVHAIPSAEPLENFALQRARLARYGACTGPDGCYWADLDAQYRRAELALTEALSHRRSGSKLALVLDVDETTLSNYCEMKREDFGYIAPLYDAWSMSKAAAVAIPGALRLFHQAQAAGVAVFFITGRPGVKELGLTPGSPDQTEATARNLEAAGFGGWSGLRLRNRKERFLPTIEYKQQERASLQKAGYEIVMSVGDQWSDLLGEASADVSIKLPNPFYFIP